MIETEDHNKLIFVGIIVAAHGITGSAIIKSFTEPVTNICALSVVNSRSEPLCISLIKLIRKNNNTLLICKINDFSTRTEIESLIKTKLYCKIMDLPKVAKNEFYIENLKNLKVLDSDKKNIGIIKNIYNFGAGDIIEINFNTGQLELFPFKNEFFGEIGVDFIILRKRYE